MDKEEAQVLSRYKQLLERASFDLKLAQDLALSMKLPFNRLARLQRAKREICDEQRDAAGGK